MAIALDEGPGKMLLFRPPPSMVGGACQIQIGQEDGRFSSQPKLTAATVRAMATTVVGHIQTHVPADITVHEVFVTWEHHMYVLVGNDINSRRPCVRHLPGFVGSIRVLYAKQSDLGRLPPPIQAQRAIEPDFKTLSRFASEHDIAIGNDCFMKPQTGLLDGKVAGLSLFVEGSRLCNAYTWVYFGQNQNTGSVIQPPDTVSGSAIWDKDGLVYGTCQFYVERGPYVGLSFAANMPRLNEEGFSLVKGSSVA